MNSIRRIQRSLRTPMSEGQATATIVLGSSGRIDVPSDLLNLIWISVNGRELTERSFSEINRYNHTFPQGVGRTEYYCRVGGQYIIAPRPGAGTAVDIYYYRDLAPLVNDTDTNALIDVAPDLVTYGALIDAADWSIDPDRMSIWNEAFTTLFAEIQDMAERDVLANASIGACIPLIY
uniref:phage adaptor protein n=1 Tax=Methylobacterium sp. B34 TaxID=95563 RepID=UPI0003452750|nr:hypothetical protein [Methylobacterium sp. B34]